MILFLSWKLIWLNFNLLFFLLGMGFFFGFSNEGFFGDFRLLNVDREVILSFFLFEKYIK